MLHFPPALCRPVARAASPCPSWWRAAVTARLRFPLSCLLALALVGVAFGSAPGVVAAETPEMAPAKRATPHFAAPASLDLAKVLPPPPAPGSMAADADLESVREAQMWRTEVQIAWAKRVDVGDMFMYGDVLGPWFKAENLPLTAALLHDVNSDVRLLGESVKDRFQRPRPPLVDSRIQPCVPIPKSSSYPSGHTLRFFVAAEILGDAFPEKRAALLDYAHRAVWGRIIGGVHFPSDLVGGWTTAHAFAAEIRKSEAFRTRFEACRQELEAAAKVP